MHLAVLARQIKTLLVTVFVAFAAIPSCEYSRGLIISERQEGIRLISEGKYSDAIVIFENLLTDDPKNEDYRKNLAAAHAGRAGLAIKKFISLVDKIVKSTKSNKSDFDSSAISLLNFYSKQAEDPQQKALVGYFITALKAIYTLENLIAIFNEVPKITVGQNLEDIKKALLVLEGRDDISKDAFETHPIKLEKHNTLYRALIRITLLNYDIRHTYKFSSMQSCEVKKEQLIDDAESLIENIGLFLNDVAETMSDKKSKEDVQALSKTLNDLFKEALVQLDSPMLETMINMSPLAGALNRKCEK